MKRIILWFFCVILLTACAAVTSPDSSKKLVEENNIPVTESLPASQEPTSVSVDKPSTGLKIPSEPGEILPLGTEVGGANKSAVIMGDAVIIYRRSGGFAGIDEQWTIYSDGRIEGPDGIRRQVTSEQVHELLDIIQTAGFLDFDDSYIPLDNCCDQITYSISVQLNNQVKTVNTIDNQSEQPEQLTAVIRAINALLSDSE